MEKVQSFYSWERITNFQWELSLRCNIKLSQNFIKDKRDEISQKTKYDSYEQFLFLNNFNSASKTKICDCLLIILFMNQHDTFPGILKNFIEVISLATRWLIYDDSDWLGLKKYASYFILRKAVTFQFVTFLCFDVPQTEDKLLT